MDYLYVLLNEGSEWEDMVILLSKDEAVSESKKYPKCRVEIFIKNKNTGYTPTYNYYKNGELVKH
jgi:hypothetical protein